MECLQFAGSTPVSRVILMCAGRSLRGVVAVKHSKSCLKLYLCRRITKKHFDLSPCMYSTVQNLASNRCGASDLCLAGPSWHAMVIVAHTAQRPKSRWVSTPLMPIHRHTRGCGLSCKLCCSPLAVQAAWVRWMDAQRFGEAQ